MKSTIRLHQFMFMAVSLFACATTSQAAVILNDAVVTDRPPTGGPDGFQYLNLTKSTQSGGGLVSSRITDLGSGTFRFQYWAIAELYAFYQVSEGMQITPAFVLATTPFFTNSNQPGSGTLSLAMGASTLLGYWDDRTIPGTGPAGPQDNFGWVRITRTDTGLVASESVTALGGGIIVGTTTQIPEPSSPGLFLVAVGGIAVGIRRRSR